MKKILLALVIMIFNVGCFQQERHCTNFKTGTFEFYETIDSIQEKAVFYRNDSLQIETFRGKTDTSTVRWINDCEFIIQKLHPKNRQEKKAIHMKIMTTNENGYLFEYGFVGEKSKRKGEVSKVK
uniref:DNA topoisomerase IV n=1 Tax=Flavobacterium sp. TaxID=239 RepID=UPI00404A832A